MRWYWCLDHARAEDESGCPADHALGPYASRAEAEAAPERVRERTAAQDARDKADDDWGR